MKRNFYKLIGILSFIMIGTAFPLLAQGKLNRKPFQDFAVDLGKNADKNVDLTKPFSVTLTGVLTKEGKLDPRKSFFIKTEGDAEMITIAKSAIEAVSNSGMLSYLSEFGAEKIQIDLLQNETDLSANIRSELPTEAKTQTIASGLNMVFQVAKIKALDSDEKTLLNATKTASDGKFLIINFAIPKDEAHKIIKQKLEKSEKPQ